MLTKEQFQQKIKEGFSILDGATGSNLRNAGMPKGCCAELWILEHPEPLVALQRAYAEAGSKIIYAPTFQAQPIALKAEGMERQTEKINEALVLLPAVSLPVISERSLHSATAGTKQTSICWWKITAARSVVSLRAVQTCWWARH